jgi:integrase
MRLSEKNISKRLGASDISRTGLRIISRGEDIEFEYNQIIVREGKGKKDRVTVLPKSLKEPLRQHLEEVKKLHEADLKQGYGVVDLPYALARKYPNAGREFAWQLTP